MNILNDRFSRMEIKLDIMSQHQRVKKTSNHGDHGDRVIGNLKNRNEYITFTPEPRERAVLNETQSEAAKNIFSNPEHQECDLVAYMTPFFEAILKDIDLNLVYVNGERYPWIETVSGNNLKPDGFVANKCNVIFRPPYAGAPDCTPSRLFGEGIWDIRDSINSIWDAKKKVSNEGYGDLCTYLEICSNDRPKYFDQTDVIFKGVVYDAEEFRLVTSTDSTITKTTVAKWTDAGSYDLMKNFLSVQDPWDSCLYQLCSDLNVTIPVVSDTVGTVEKSSFFLGSGAFGRVYKVNNITNNALFALKIVITNVESNLEKVYGEYELLMKAQKKPHVIPIVNDSFRQGSMKFKDKNVYYAGYLMNAIGTSIIESKTTKTTKVTNTTIYKLLTSLHALHKNGISHGDARIYNAVLIDEVVYWVDFRDVALTAVSTGCASDIKKLLESVGIIFEINEYNLYKANYNIEAKEKEIINMFKNLSKRERLLLI